MKAKGYIWVNWGHINLQKNYNTKLILWLIFFIGFSYGLSRAQNHHEHTHGAEHYFENVNLYTIIQSTQLTERYQHEKLIREYVDRKFSDFYNQIDSMIDAGGDLSRDEFNDLVIDLESEIQMGASTIAPIPDLPEVNPLQINGPCENMDFEWGNYNGWTASMAFRTNGSLYDFSGAVTSPPPAAQCQVVGPGVVQMFLLYQRYSQVQVEEIFRYD